MYQYKYNKYKNKYLQLRKHIHGGKINVDGIGVRLTLDEYNNLSKEEQDIFPFYCNIETPYLCSLNTSNYGLCKNSLEECSNEYTGENTLLNYDMNDSTRKELYDFGKKYNYDISNRGKNCASLRINSEREYLNPPFNMPKRFKIMTYNIWNSMQKNENERKDNFNLNFMRKRIDEICNM